MTTLIDRAKEIKDAIRHCANTEGISGCRQCYYYTNGCRYSLMLVSARIIDRLIQELKEAIPIEHGQWNIDGVYVICSVCNKPTLSPIVKQLPTFKYCPNCGTKMYKEEYTMSESREHKRRYNLRLEYIAHFTEWLNKEPPMIFFWKWRKWKNERPIWKDM